MAVYTKETALYDTGKMANDIGEAGETASKYITAVDSNGIKVHAENNPTANYSLINATGLEVVNNSASVAKFGSTIRLGDDSDIYLKFENDSGISKLSLVDPEDSEVEPVQIKLHHYYGNNELFITTHNVDPSFGGESYLHLYNDGTDCKSILNAGVCDFRLEQTLGSLGRITCDRGLNVLWSGQPAFVLDTQTLMLSDEVSDQLNGIVLVWSRYANSTAQNDSWSYQFIPKWHVSAHSGGGIYYSMPTSMTSATVCIKYVYVYDDYITGHANNSATGTGYANNTRVLRAVLGV